MFLNDTWGNQGRQINCCQVDKGTILSFNICSQTTKCMTQKGGTSSFLFIYF